MVPPSATAQVPAVGPDSPAVSVFPGDDKVQPSLSPSYGFPTPPRLLRRIRSKDQQHLFKPPTSSPGCLKSGGKQKGSFNRI